MGSNDISLNIMFNISGQPHFVPGGHMLRDPLGPGHPVRSPEMAPPGPRPPHPLQHQVPPGAILPVTTRVTTESLPGRSPLKNLVHNQVEKNCMRR